MGKLCSWLDYLDYYCYPNVLLLGNFNAHHSFWDPNFHTKKKGDGDRSGKILLSAITYNGFKRFKMVNDKKPTCRQGNTVIDLAVVKGISSSQVVSFTDPYPILSTIHNPIITKIGQSKNNI